MKPILKTRNFFIDTSIYRQKQYHVAGKDFVALANLVKDGRAHAYTTSITRFEIQNRIDADVQAGLATRREFEKASWIFRSTGIQQRLFDRLMAPTCAQIKAALVEGVNGYFRRVRATEIPVALGQIENVFNAYSARNPPFGGGKKRHEFPDAFVLSALEHWCEVNGQQLYVISTDNDMQAYCSSCPRLFYLHSLSAFSDLVARHDNRLANFALDALKGRTSDFSALVEDLFREHSFYVPDRENDEVEISSARVSRVDEPRLISVDDDQATFETTATVQFTAELTYDDPNSGIWDSEDDVMLFVETERQTTDRSISVTVQGLLQYTANDPDSVEVYCEAINGHEDIAVPVDGPWD